MAKTKEQKSQMINDLGQGLKSAKSVVFANFQGLKVKESEELRKKCREQNITLVASKKSLLRKALEATGITLNTDGYNGGVAAVFGQADEVAPAQLVAEFAKKHELVTIFGGILEGSLIDGAKVQELAKLPSKQQLLGQLVGTLNAPVSGLVNILAGNLRNLVGVLNNIKESKA